MAILGTPAWSIYDVNLVVQIILVVVLVVGIIRRRPVKRHGIILMTATVANLVATFLVMAPSLILYLSVVTSGPFTLGVAITVGHSIAGSIAIFFGLLFSLRFLKAVRSGKTLACGTRGLMRVTAILWLFSLGGGFAFYFYYYLQ